jgi:polysaccharide export outer membrane protein
MYAMIVLREKIFGTAALLALLAVNLLNSGCTTANVEVSTNRPASLINSETIKAGEQLNITVILPGAEKTNPNNIPIEQKVKSDGTINLVLIGDVKAEGKSVRNLEKDIFDAYVPKYYKRCTVVVKQTDRFFFVDGQVKQPNRFMYAGEITLMGAVAAAGGPTDYANKKKVQITRSNGKIEVVNIIKALDDPNLDLPIYPGDRVNVPRRW